MVYASERRRAPEGEDVHAFVQSYRLESKIKIWGYLKGKKRS
jgi:hypothetical protein